MRTKTGVLVGMVFILAAALMVSFSMSRSNVFVQSREMPVFFGEELIVNKVAETSVAMPVSIVVAKPLVAKVAKAQVVPAPAPKVAAPFPIFPPKISYQVLPQYSMRALEKGLSGTTLLSVYIGVSGKPEKVAVKSSSGVAELDRSAQAAVSKWIFEPASQGGQAIASWFEVPVRFSINDE